MESTRRNFNNRRLASLQSELSEIEYDIETAKTNSERSKFKKDAEKILNEIDKLEALLNEDDRNSKVSGVRINALDTTLRKVDFTQARNIASQLKTVFESEDGGSTILVLQKTSKQMGYNCLDEMLSTIFEHEIQDIHIQNKIASLCKVYKADLASSASEGFALGCLKLLSGYNGPMNSSDDVLNLGRTFRKSLCDSLRSGDRVLILVKDWHYVEPEKFLVWFVEDFWKPLLDEVKKSVLPEYGCIKIVAVLASGGAIRSDCLSNIKLCSLDSFHPHHVIDVPLPDWTVEDIQKWFMDVQKLGRNESFRLAQQFYADSDGTPQTVCSMLKEKYSA
jgi:hypothetical protein